MLHHIRPVARVFLKRMLYLILRQCEPLGRQLADRTTPLCSASLPPLVVRKLEAPEAPQPMEECFVAVEPPVVSAQVGVAFSSNSGEAGATEGPATRRSSGET